MCGSGVIDDPGPRNDAFFSGILQFFAHSVGLVLAHVGNVTLYEQLIADGPHGTRVNRLKDLIGRLG